jgi:feruloyl esterase
MKQSVFVSLALLSCIARACGQSTNHTTIEDLRRLRLPDVVLESATHVATYVEVHGVIGGDVRFELLLPDAWNGRFVMGGGGGFVGTVQNSARYSVNSGYATVGTDTGHEWQPGYMAGWALDNLEAKLNFGYLAVHRTVAVAKALIRGYYGSDPAYCYFTGCSRGGGQAMMEAQRFPEDFDGIVAGAPAFDWTGFAAGDVAIAKALYPSPEHLDQTSLDREALRKLQQAILDQCDAQDGLKDGVVQDPPSAQRH